VLRQVLDANARLLGVPLAAARWWSDVLAGAFGATGLEGRRFVVRCGGQPLEAVVDSVRVEPRAGRFGARLALRHVKWDGLRFDRVTAVAHRVAVSAPPDASLTATDVVIEGRAALEPLVLWLDRRVSGWNLTVGQHGLEAVRRGGRVRLEVEPAVRDDVLELEVRGIGWRGMHVRLPFWSRVTRSSRLEALPEGVSIQAAQRHGTTVELRLSVRRWRRSLA